MSRPTRITRQTSTNPNNFDHIFDTLYPGDEDLLMQQALLEAVGRFQTPTSESIGARSRRSSTRPPAYDPAQPNAPADAVPYDPTTWNALSEASSGSRRSSTPALGPVGMRYSPTTPAYSPSLRSQRQTQQYDPTSPLYGRSDRLYDPAGFAWRSPSVVPGGEPSPGYSYYGGYGAAQASPTSGNVAARLDRLFDRLDRVEAQLTAITDFLTDELNGTTPTVNTSSQSLSGNKRKRPSNKKVSFGPFEEESDSDVPSTPPKKSKPSPKKSPSPKTPPKQPAASSPKAPKAPRKAAPKRPAPVTPARQIAFAAPAPAAAPHKSVRTADPRRGQAQEVEPRGARASSRIAARAPVDYSGVERKKTKRPPKKNFCPRK